MSARREDIAVRRTSNPLVLCGRLFLAIGCAKNDAGDGEGTGARRRPAAPALGVRPRQRRLPNRPDAKNQTQRARMEDPRMFRASTPLMLVGCLFMAGLGCSKAGGDGSGSGGVGSGGNGRAGSTGTAGATGTAGTTGSTGTGGTGTSASCTFTVTSSTSSKIPTVGIVTWSTTLASPTEAHINFGLDTSYGMTAPVDLTVASFRTLLLGMKASKTYHFQVSASASAGTCTSQDYMIATGPQPNGMQGPSVTTSNKAALYGGFLITGQYVQNVGSSGAPAYILDSDGDFVWWYNDGSDATGVRMSYDGNYMWINNANVPPPNSPTSEVPHVHRVTMDGLTDTDFSVPFDKLSHQITPLPDGSVAFYATGSNGCDDIKLFPAGGTPASVATTLVNAKTAHGGTGACHLNNIEYSSSDDTLVFSDLDNDCLTKVSRTTGATVWILNGGINGVTSSFTGDTWAGGEHGFHILGLDDFVIFNNNSGGAGNVSGGPSNGTGDGSIALEMKLDLTAKTATKSWSYKAVGPTNKGIQVDVLGDVQRLGNGNTIVDYATKGEIQEVDANGNVLQDLSLNGTNFGYIEKRATLYGPSPR
jgi:hypothetical protein